MFPAAVVADAALATLAFRVASSNLGGSLSSLALGSLDIPRSLLVAIAWSLVTLVVGSVLLFGRPSATRSVRDDTLERPDLAFATGFLVFFAPLVAVSLPLFVATYVDHPAVIAVGALVVLPGLLLCSALLLVGGCVGAIIVGDRLGRLAGSDSPSLRRGLAVGTIVLGSSQLVPVLGAVVAIALTTVGIGGIVRRRFDPWNDAERGGDERGRSDADAAVAGTSSTEWNAADSSETEIWHASRERRDGAASGSTRDASETGPDGSVDEWEWALDDDGDRDDSSRESDDR